MFNLITVKQPNKSDDIRFYVKGKTLTEACASLFVDNNISHQITPRVGFKAIQKAYQDNYYGAVPKTLTTRSRELLNDTETDVVITSLSDLVGWIARNLASGFLRRLIGKFPFKLTLSA